MRRAPIKTDLSADVVRSLFNYEPETGHFTWKVRRPKIQIGARAGCLRQDGYREIMVNGSAYREHRLAWLYVTGAWPDFDVDHIDRNRSNNSWANLRQATRSLNCRNALHAGCHQRKEDGRIMAYISGHDGKRIHLGYFDTKEAGHAAYRQASVEMFGEFSPFFQSQEGRA
jgi:hypothetical protein